MDDCEWTLDQELVAALDAAWQDTVPLLDYAIEMDRSHTVLAIKLKWYADYVMSAVRSIPITVEAVTWQFWPMQREAYMKLRRHPQCWLLSQVAAIAFCRIPVFWQHIPDTSKELLEAGLLCARTYPDGESSSTGGTRKAIISNRCGIGVW